MSLGELQRRDVDTPLGALSFWGLPEDAEATRPVLVAVAGIFTPLGGIDRLPKLLDAIGHAVIVELPLRGPNGIEEPSLARLADALGLAVHKAFARRRVVLLGFADAALAAVMARAPEILRVVAVEPPLQTGKIWPLRQPLGDLVRTETGAGIRKYLAEVYGASPEGHAPRDHRPVFQQRRTAVDVVVGDRPLTPEPAPERPSSHLDAADRAWLSNVAGAAVEVAPNAGHAIAREAGGFLLDVARRALAWAAGATPEAEGVGRRLAYAAPRDARRVRYIGPAPEAFQAAYAALNPHAASVPASPATESFDLLVLQDSDLGASNWDAHLEGLAPEGVVIATAPLGSAGRLLTQHLIARGLSLAPDDPAITPQASALVRARLGPSRPTTRVAIFPYARTLMDIRTRLPADAMRSDPDLEIDYHHPPFRQTALSDERAKVLILQRPGAVTANAWREAAAKAILARSVLVIEYDDHPDLVSRMILGKGLEEADWERFRVSHAVQTSTSELREVFGAYNPEVQAFQNAVFELKPFEAGPRPTRVFYGGVTRGPFAIEVARALRPAIEAYPHIEFSVLGDRAFFEALPTSRKTFNEYVIYERYLQVMAECSVSLSPLHPQAMIETKSDAKYLDASRAGVVTIASPTVYERVIRSGTNGLIARELEDWPRMLAQVIGDQALRERLARAAWDDVRAHRMFARQIADRRTWYADLLARREELNAALLERSPGVAAALRRLGGA